MKLFYLFCCLFFHPLLAQQKTPEDVLLSQLNSCFKSTHCAVDNIVRCCDETNIEKRRQKLYEIVQKGYWNPLYMLYDDLKKIRPQDLEGTYFSQTIGYWDSSTETLSWCAFHILMGINYFYPTHDYWGRYYRCKQPSYIPERKEFEPFFLSKSNAYGFEPDRIYFPSYDDGHIDSETYSDAVNRMLIGCALANIVRDGKEKYSRLQQLLENDIVRNDPRFHTLVNQFIQDEKKRDSQLFLKKLVFGSASIGCVGSFYCLCRWLQNPVTIIALRKIGVIWKEHWRACLDEIHRS